MRIHFWVPIAIMTCACKTFAGAGDTIYLLSYFKGNGEMGVYLAGSADGLSFRDLKPAGPSSRRPTGRARTSLATRPSSFATASAHLTNPFPPKRPAIRSGGLVVAPSRPALFLRQGDSQVERFGVDRVEDLDLAADVVGGVVEHALEEQVVDVLGARTGDENPA